VSGRGVSAAAFGSPPRLPSCRGFVKGNFDDLRAEAGLERHKKGDDAGIVALF
jgi:hypothetical protein